MNKKLKKVYLELGCNLGDCKNNLEKCIEILNMHSNLKVLKSSKIYLTKPEGVGPQPNFYNCALEIETDLTSDELLILTQDIEISFGRKSKGDMAPREMDIDILLYEDDVVCSENLTIPHPLLHERYFVLLCLNEIAPDLKHPILGETVNNLYQQKVCTTIK
ncbi:2-amino-4-hydroxy-6-hydroxymethyldihydropteridine diphosphokinase [bacterium]|nr:2-amino-4-hydroxy-6-hydroxymethyldihydropteridine diphosphokinase [bacterium]